MAEPRLRKSLADRWRDDPFSLFGGFVGFLLLAVLATVVLHGRAAEVVGTPLALVAFVFLCMSGWFGVSGYRRRTGRSRAR